MFKMKLFSDLILTDNHNFTLGDSTTECQQDNFPTPYQGSNNALQPTL